MVGPSVRDMRQRVQFLRAVSAPDALGGFVQSWQPYGSSRACNMTPYRAQKRGGAEEVLAARLQGTAVFDLWVRWDSLTKTVTPDDRVYDVTNPAQIFNIRFCQDMDSRHQRILMQVELGTAA